MSETNRATRGSKARQEEATVGEVIDFVKAYAKQETLGPLAGAGRWLAYGAAASLALSVGLGFVLLGLLRLLQTEFREHLGGSWTWVAYVIVLVVTIAMLALVLTRIKKSALNNEPK